MSITRRVAASRIVAAIVAWLMSPASSFAATPTLDVSQFGHAAWTAENGFAKGAIYSIAQTPDGYLWLGTEFGLLRFDGVTTTPWPPDQPIVNEVPSLIAARDGTLWIGMAGGLATGKAGHLTRHAEPSPSRPHVTTMYEDRNGNLWFAESAGLWQWNQGHPTYYPLGRDQNVQALGEDAAQHAHSNERMGTAWFRAAVLFFRTNAAGSGYPV